MACALLTAYFTPVCFDDNSCSVVQSLNSSYNNLLEKKFNNVALAKNLIAYIDTSETKVLPNEFFP